jgi:hypothetical protein
MNFHPAPVAPATGSLIYPLLVFIALRSKLGFIQEILFMGKPRGKLLTDDQIALINQQIRTYQNLKDLTERLRISFRHCERVASGEKPGSLNLLQSMENCLNLKPGILTKRLGSGKPPKLLTEEKTLIFDTHTSKALLTGNNYPSLRECLLCSRTELYASVKEKQEQRERSDRLHYVGIGVVVVSEDNKLLVYPRRPLEGDSQFQTLPSDACILFHSSFRINVKNEISPMDRFARGYVTVKEFLDPDRGLLLDLLKRKLDLRLSAIERFKILGVVSKEDSKTAFTQFVFSACSSKNNINLQKAFTYGPLHWISASENPESICAGPKGPLWMDLVVWRSLQKALAPQDSPARFFKSFII